MKRPDERATHRSNLPRPLREILNPAVRRLATTDQARAYGAWMSAAGAPVASAARPSGFFNGLLTVECASSVWANELTYLSSQILTRMNELTPGQPVKRLRFVVGQSALPEPVAPVVGPPQRRYLTSDSLSAAVEATDDVRDERLRQAILAALRTSAGDS